MCMSGGATKSRQRRAKKSRAGSSQTSGLTAGDHWRPQTRLYAPHTHTMARLLRNNIDIGSGSSRTLNGAALPPHLDGSRPAHREARREHSFLRLRKKKRRRCKKRVRFAARCRLRERILMFSKTYSLRCLKKIID